MTTSNLPAEALVNPKSIPPLHSIRQTFWDCLLEAEHIFGPRASGWKLLVYTWDNPYPMTSNDGHDRISIWLTEHRSWIGYYYEAAHEAVHCLNPIQFMENARYLEEAVATVFSLDVVRRNFGEEGYSRCGVSPQYDYARNLAYEIDTDIIRLGQRLRQRAVALEHVTPDIIKELYPDADDAAVSDVLRRFPRQ